MVAFAEHRTGALSCSWQRSSIPEPPERIRKTGYQADSNMIVTARVTKYWAPSLTPKSYIPSLIHACLCLKQVPYWLSFFPVSTLSGPGSKPHRSVPPFATRRRIASRRTHCRRMANSRTTLSSKILESVFHGLRRDVMQRENIGLTDLYNRFHDPADWTESLAELRYLQVEIDERVSGLYGWEDIQLEHDFREVPYLPENDRMSLAISEKARLEILDRLGRLNRERYEWEVANGLQRRKVGGRRRKTVAAKTAGSGGSGRKKRAGRATGCRAASSMRKRIDRDRVDRTISFKPTFLKELGKLPANQQSQVLAKVGILATDPEPDAKSRKRLKGVEDGLCRLRSGDCRVFYSYDDASVSLYSVRRRSEDTYDAMPDAVELAHGTFETPAERVGPSAEDWQKWITPPDDSTPLPEPIRQELLEAWTCRGIPARLLEVGTQEDLLSCPGVPDEFLLAIDEHMFVKPIELVVEEPTLVAPGGVDDLLRFTEGRLVGFLLKLDPDQERYVSWDTNAAGPTLLRGGPGTGKTTVALYRVREILRRLREDGNDRPRILFTTYTNALVTFSKQLLESLLGDEFDAR